MNQKFADYIQKFAGKKLAVAVSGGVDSVCLLHWCKLAGMDVTGLHVNHGLRAAADIETDYVCDLCKKLDVPCQIFYWTGEKPTVGLESAAREARYKMMTEFGCVRMSSLSEMLSELSGGSGRSSKGTRRFDSVALTRTRR